MQALLGALPRDADARRLVFSPSGRLSASVTGDLRTLRDAAIVLGARTGDKVSLVVSVAPSLVARGVKAGEVVRVAAQVVGGGGGGRDTMAQAGGKDPEKLDDALSAAREAIAAALA